MYNQLSGNQTRQQCQHVPEAVLHHPTAFPITPIQLQFQYAASIITRVQFPIVPAYATTTYKRQSRSMQHVIAHVQYSSIVENQPPQQKTITADHMYVQCSRCRQGSDLKLFPILLNIQQTARQHHIIEILDTMPLYQFQLRQLQLSELIYNIAFHNGQGCSHKLEHYSADDFYKKMSIICLSELHSPLENRCINNFELLVEFPGQRRNGTGMAIFIKPEIQIQHLCSQRFTQGQATIEIQGIQFNSILLFYIYCNPHTSTLFLRQTINTTMETFVLQHQWRGTIICFGDFNSACSTENSIYFTQQYRLETQTTTVPTHRSGSYIDKALSNSSLQLQVYPTYWSDHSTIWFTL